MNITKEALLAAGYHPHPVREAFCLGLYQKTVHGSDGRKNYFITVKLYDLPHGIGLRPSVDVPLFRPRPSDEGNVQSFRLELGIESETTIEELEAFYAEAYAIYHCIPDIHNN